MSASERRNITIAITVGVYLFLLFEKAIHLVIPHQHSHVSVQILTLSSTRAVCFILTGLSELLHGQIMILFHN